MARHPATQMLVEKYGHGTGLSGAPDDPAKQQAQMAWQPPRFARPTEKGTSPNAMMFAPNNPYAGEAGMPLQQLVQQSRQTQPPGLPSPAQLGPKPSSLGVPAALKKPLMDLDFWQQENS